MAYLVAAARAGDRRAADRLVQLAGPRLFSHARRLLGEAEAARDVVQSAWVEVFRGLRGLRDDHLFLPWALRIVSRAVAREIAQRQRGRSLAQGVADVQEVEVAPEAEDRLNAAAVRRAVAALPPAHQATVALFYLEDMSVAEVAAAMDVPPGTVKTRLMHARDKLRALMKGEDDVQ